MNILREKCFILAGLMVGMILLSGACSSIPWGSEASEPTPVPVVTQPSSVSAEGRLVPLRYDALSFKSGGVLGEVFVSEGELVDQGDVVAILGELELLEAALSQAKLELQAAQQELDRLHETATLSREQAGQALVEARTALTEAKHILTNLDTEDFRQQLDERTIELEEAEGELDEAKEELDQYQDLDPDDATRVEAQAAYEDARREYENAVYERDRLQNQLDQAHANVDLATASLDHAQLEFNKQQDGVDPDRLALAEVRVVFAEDQLAAAQRALDNANLIAPYKGSIAQLADLYAGQNLMAGQPVITLADYSGWMVETRDLTELDVVNVRIGQVVRVKPDALPELDLSGTVESIDQIFTERIGDVLFTVHIRLNETDPRLRWGMTVNAVFER
ncbi:MAG: HlyD family efflux transporter periplasmic adaptor subunit [Anaerolineales bacterium]|nr:HlyD family efflux transporter periplasmic adaptor subunit [Anaerolineales bacterium]